VILAVPSVIAGFLNIPGVKLGSLRNFTDWVGARVVTMGDYHPEAIEWSLAAFGLLAAGLGIALGWLLYNPDAETQKARDRFEIPALYPLLRRKYYIDDIAMEGLVNPIKGPIARAVDAFNTYVLDTIVNSVGFFAGVLGRFVYAALDQRGIDAGLNAIAGSASGAGRGLRLLQSGKVQQYAGAFVIGAVLLVAGFVIFT
jgi:NADH:ubiquinone oxidoreductase subunit 5 (subunit L)/multisubunit Na+/H+ antiporter MnhA subunit